MRAVLALRRAVSAGIHALRRVASSIVGEGGELTVAPFWGECGDQKFPEGNKSFTLNQLVLKLTDDTGRSLSSMCDN